MAIPGRRLVPGVASKVARLVALWFGDDCPGALLIYLQGRRDFIQLKLTGRFMKLLMVLNDAVIVDRPLPVSAEWKGWRTDRRIALAWGRADPHGTELGNDGKAIPKYRLQFNNAVQAVMPDGVAAPEIIERSQGQGQGRGLGVRLVQAMEVIDLSGTAKLPPAAGR